MEQIALDGITRMKRRSDLAADVAGQFWEELVGRILDQVRAMMRRAQETVANWKEFGPEEVELLSHAEQNKATALNEVTVAVEQTRAVLEDLKESLGAADTARLQARIEALEQEKARIAASSALAFPSTGEARRLLAAGALEEAIAAYSSLISASPDSHTLYIARARARYLGGDPEGALTDLEEAEKRCPTDPSIARLRNEIKEGRKPTPVTVTAQPAWSDDVMRGNAALAAGRGQDALVHYRAAGKAGLIPVFAVQNEAMALLLLGQTSRVRDTIQPELPSMTGPFVRAQALALLALADAMDELDDSQWLQQLRDHLRQLSIIGSPFNLAESPLQHLGLGLYRTGRMAGRVSHVFELLRGNDSHGEA